MWSILTVTIVTLFSILLIVIIVYFAIVNPKDSQSFTVVPKQLPLTFDKPVFITYDPFNENNDTLFVVEEVGRIQQVTTSGDKLLWFDMVSDVQSNGFEQGLLGFAFDPIIKGQFFVYFTNKDNHIIVRKYSSNNILQGTDIIVIKNDTRVHNGGWIGFGPTNGYLYIATGDMSSRTADGMKAQDLTSLAGKILCIDVSDVDHYNIPTTNPYIQSSTARHEIIASGLRNPWRCSFDTNGHLWIGNVGHTKFEEIDIMQTPGDNFMWPCMEATYKRPQCDHIPTNGISPHYYYPHDKSSAVIVGGYMYRGSDPNFTDKYIFGDFSSGDIYILTNHSRRRIATLHSVSSFGESRDGTIFACDYLDGLVYQITNK